MALAAGLFVLAGWAGALIPRNNDADSAAGPRADGVEVMVETNGIHTAIVMPMVTQDVDWRQDFPGVALARGGEMPTHVSIGWGEREVFLDTPTWGDLKIGTALRIAFAGGPSVMRVASYVRPAPGPDHRPVVISRAGYRRLARSIRASLPDAGGGPRQPLRGVERGDTYYAALGHYTLANSCNTWTGERLADAGLPMGRWTPFAGGVMRWIEPPATPGP
ncbi:DUF2459 domain-containing protein [Altererythrobacter buctensis]|uniref:DUF2459 domain-containing protein n=2 Tax=Alteraurantiacibacter buctensis TaxID=1503981 RepID=A0A844Z0Z9_9SPHN|nr:DUF2459 domain-containing protein [Alteraurantiacibacter buctensis]MXO71583.1 DUF2459 domain-containing protein [Alteraurantiacibacter buctensis]